MKKVCALIFATAAVCGTRLTADDKPQAVEKFDRNFRIIRDGAADFEIHSPFSAPFEIAGMPWNAERKLFRRMPVNTPVKLPSGVEEGARHTSGVMVRFRTDSPVIFIRCTLAGTGSMPHMPRSGQSGIDVYAGAAGRERVVAVLFSAAEERSFARQVALGGRGMTSVTLNLPLYDGVETLEIGVKPGAKLATPAPFALAERVVFYGSSTIQGGCVSRPGHGLTNQLSRALNVEFVNLGFSGSGQAEPEVGEVIASLDKVALFIVNVDSNNTVERLRERFARFIAALRKRHPDAPILVLTRHRAAAEARLLDAGRKVDSIRTRRSEYLRSSVEKMREKGDRNLHFFDGAELLGNDFDLCTVDGSHLGDIGFARMSEKIKELAAPLLKLQREREKK